MSAEHYLPDASGILRRDAESNINDSSYFPAAPSGKRNRECADLARSLEGGTDVLACTGRCKAYQRVALRAQGFHMALEDSFVAVVVPNGGQN